jgi:hypothetical protein
MSMRAKSRVPHPFAFFANGWETTNVHASEKRAAAPPQVLADDFLISSHNDPRSLRATIPPETAD